MKLPEVIPKRRSLQRKPFMKVEKLWRRRWVCCKKPWKKNLPSAANGVTGWSIVDVEKSEPVCALKGNVMSHVIRSPWAGLRYFKALWMWASWCLTIDFVRSRDIVALRWKFRVTLNIAALCQALPKREGNTAAGQQWIALGSNLADRVGWLGGAFSHKTFYSQNNQKHVLILFAALCLLFSLRIVSLVPWCASAVPRHGCDHRPSLLGRPGSSRSAQRSKCFKCSRLVSILNYRFWDTK